MKEGADVANVFASFLRLLLTSGDMAWGKHLLVEKGHRVGKESCESNRKCALMGIVSVSKTEITFCLII